MKAFVRSIGIIDRNGGTHSVSFGPGVNVVTGRSSTGKSALIEIFDFCFGSADFTVPEGVITQHADIFFCVLAFEKTNIVLARRRDDTKAFLKEENDAPILQDPPEVNAAYFQNSYFLALDDFKKELGRYFRLGVTDPDESAEARLRRGRKAPSPSVRSLTSFVLQHQNLIANKHAIFYRFDEREKREQVIEHFKIFAGFVDQTYFVKQQELAEKIAEARRIEFQIPRADQLRQRAEDALTNGLLEFTSISGQYLDIGLVPQAIRNPQRALDELAKVKVEVVPLSDEHARQKQAFDREIASLTADLRQKQRKLSEIRSSIEFSKHYASAAGNIVLPAEAELRASTCPFCNARHSVIEGEANRLLEAIEWLNEELQRSPYMLESFEDAEKKVLEEANVVKTKIEELVHKAAGIDLQIANLAQYRSQYELSLRAKYRIESVLEGVLSQRQDTLAETLAELQKEINAAREFLKQNYSLTEKLAAAENTLRVLMKEIGGNFEFEESYRPINLQFSLETFDLWHVTPTRKVFLRAMGSGANWLYCHITLFLALHKYFCRLGAQCSIPSILFLDQPSQVYFPSVLDTGEKFSPEELANKEGEARKRPIDDDVAAVTNLFDQLVAFCAEAKTSTGIEPQIIVTDHADNLTLSGSRDFESLVKGRRWRSKGTGFIQLDSQHDGPS